MGDEIFFQNNPFEEVRRRTDLTGLEKIRQVFAADSSDKEREAINTQAVSILKVSEGWEELHTKDRKRQG